MAFKDGTIPNCLRPAAERDDRPIVYICFRVWEPSLKWAARMDGWPSWVFAPHRDDAINGAIIRANDIKPGDSESLAEIRAAVRIKTFEVRPPKPVAQTQVADRR